jgi:hypothetical protein
MKADCGLLLAAVLDGGFQGLKDGGVQFGVALPMAFTVFETVTVEEGIAV